METCSICLDLIKEDHVQKILTCGHSLHFRCFVRMVYRNINVFIACPVCRVVNKDVTKPFSDPEKNIKILCSSKIGKVRCLCRTNKGTVCKRKGQLLNYGMCYQHHPNILKKEFYPLMEKYMYFILCQRYNFISRLFSIDIGKKLIIKFATKETSIEDILIYWLKYVSIKNSRSVKDYNEVYEFYDLEKPDEGWIEYCSRNNIII
tara:strand:- start:4909 stop:5523 length:615 start_codon:yes stop_codon:yes gene_type:complete